MSADGTDEEKTADVGEVRLALEGEVARVTFDRPRARNAMTPAMYEQLDEALAMLEGGVRRGSEAGDAGGRVRIVVLRGAAGSFVAGTDISGFADFDGSGNDGLAYEARLEEVVGRLEALPLPTLAVVEGYAVGGGLALAAVCDLRICTPDARFGMPIARTVGNCLSMANLARLVAHLGPARTRALLFLADFLEAEEARDAGFVLEVVEQERLDHRIDALTRRIADHAPITMRVTKEAMRRLLQAVEADDEDLIRRAYASRDFREGVRAFLEKRDPEWEGR